MKIRLYVTLSLICLATTLKAETEKISTSYYEDKILIKKVASELLDGKINYELKFDQSSNAGVITKAGKFEITIGEKAYDEYGPTEGSLALVCHELGHAAAGNKKFVSSEEDADYWATKICMPKILGYFPKKKTDIPTPFDNEFKKSCASFKAKNDQEICYRSLRGSYFFREPIHRDLCNTQKLSFRTSEAELSRTPYKGKRPPNMSQCSFNNLVAGTLKLKQPKCFNMMMMGFGFFGENCSPGPYTNIAEELGIEDDSTAEGSVISNVPRSTHINKTDDVIIINVKPQSVSK